MGDFEAPLPVTDLDSFLHLRQLPGRWGGEDSDGGGGVDCGTAAKGPA